MKTFPVGTDAVVSLQFADDAGNHVTPTAASYVVVDGDGKILVTQTAIDISAPPTITVPAAFNAGVGPRSIMLTMTTAGGTVISETIYGVVGLARLVFLQNTFVTYSQAVFQAINLPNIDDFNNAAKDEQSLALIEAFRRMIQLNFIIPWPELVDVQNYLYPRYAWEITPRMWPNMTADLYSRYPAEYHDAMRSAQVVEANQILKGDQMGDQQRVGLLAWSVGESKMMFKSGVGPLRRVSGMSRESIVYLKGWMTNRLSVGRAS